MSSTAAESPKQSKSSTSRISSSNSSSTFAFPFSHVASTHGRSWVIHAVHNSHNQPPSLIVSRSFPTAPRKVVLLRDTNIVVFASGTHTVTVWDEAAEHVAWTVQCAEPVQNIGVMRDFVVIIHATHTNLYTLQAPPELRHTIPTAPNPLGLHSLTDTSLTLPGPHRGQVAHLKNLTASLTATTTTPHSVTLISAHTAAISALATAPSATLVASASETGTLVRIWAVRKRSAPYSLLRELRRGVERARVWSLAFDERESAVCVTSDTLTVHIFTLAEHTTSEQDAGSSPVPGASASASHQDGSGSPGPSDRHSDGKNRTSILKPLSPYIPLPKYFSSTWSFAQFRIPPDDQPSSTGTGQSTSAPTASTAATGSSMSDSQPCMAVFMPTSSDPTTSNPVPPPPLTGSNKQTIAVLRGPAFHLFQYDTRKGGDAASIAYYKLKPPPESYTPAQQQPPRSSRQVSPEHLPSGPSPLPWEEML
ncbi:hypothetical protein DFJ77DRAFT_510586 [Powellomyces hirtus]|nr:hypothetical protein DFJ77DRAFT_510586 [Powellomyces hirtus]